MQKIFFFFSLLLAVQAGVSAQISDNFSDGNFSDNPSWQGDNSEFIVNSNGELQLNAPDAGTSLLMTQGTIPDSCIWKLNFRLEFAPSTANLLRIWLQSSDNSGSGDGYYLEIGETGSSDALRFFKQEAGTPTLLATGIAGDVATDPVDALLEVHRSASGNWTATLSKNGTTPTIQFSINDASMTGGDNLWFGFYCLYSATRKDKFFFDNISVLPDLPDQQPPVLLSAEFSSSNSLTLFFDEPLDSATAVNTANYTLNNSTNPILAEWQSATSAQVSIAFGSAFQNGQTYTVSATGILDQNGNPAGVQQTQLQYLVPETSEAFDLIINEIMADPSPSAGLPATAEWVEIYNRSTKQIQLSKHSITDGGGVAKTLPEYLMAPGEYIILCTPVSAIALSGIQGKILPMTEFPSLNNDGEPLILTSNLGVQIDRVDFSPDWHTDAAKRDGGWSLERKNPDLNCLGAANWTSCPQLPGGSPGLANFSLSTTPDNSPPQAVKGTLSATNAVLVIFSEGLDIATATDPGNYTFSPALNISEVQIDPQFNLLVTLVLDAPLAEGILYTLTIGDDITDCSGNPIGFNNTLQFGLPQIPEPGDILINEILFNPATGGSRFVEFYNNSNKIFQWNEFVLANLTGNTSTAAVTTDALFLPGTYMVLTPSLFDIVSRFAQVEVKNILQETLPSLNDKTGNITLSWVKGSAAVTVDAFDYSDTYHNALLSIGDREGVSLERIRFDIATNTPSNWTSAAQNGSPTRPNSQRAPAISTEGLLSLSSGTISPDGDGYEDFLDINLQLPATGYAATVTIFDSEGIPVKKLLRQEITQSTGSLRWDGDADNGSRVRPGIYILFAEIFNPEGKVQREKIPFAVVSKW